jgi:hypothetical protein
MPGATANVFLLEDLEGVSRTGQRAESELRTPRTFADRVKILVTRPDKDLGRDGPVCPFVPRIGGCPEFRRTSVAAP